MKLMITLIIILGINNFIGATEIKTLAKDDSFRRNPFFFTITYPTPKDREVVYTTSFQSFKLIETYADGKKLINGEEDYSSPDLIIPMAKEFQGSEHSMRVYIYKNHKDQYYMFLNGVFAMTGNVIPRGTKEFRIIYKIEYPVVTFSDEMEVIIDTSPLWEDEDSSDSTLESQ